MLHISDDDDKKRKALIFIKGADKPTTSTLDIHNPTPPKNSTLITGEAAKIFLKLAPIVNDVDALAYIIINHPQYRHECASNLDSKDRWISLLGGRKSREFNFSKKIERKMEYGL